MKSGEGELDCYRSHVQAAKGRKPKARLCGCLGSRTVGNEMNHPEVLSGLQSKQLKDDRDHDMDLLVRCGDGKEMMLRTSQPEKQAWVQALNSAKLVRSYAMDAIRQPANLAEVASSEAAMTFLRQIEDVKTRNYPAIGEGEDLRIEGSELLGGGLHARERLLHLCVFAADTQDSERDERTSSLRARRTAWRHRQ